ncbi:MAG: endolytic transglycosylase MltG [Gammaproteobacteria bacterium]|nr:endolytic transglycosylase MltG [Gammaproteobacteria bacterium]
MRWFVLAAAIFVLIALMAGGAAVYSYRYVTDATRLFVEPVEILVQHGDSLPVVANELQQAGVIKRTWPFVWLARYQEKDDKIKAGEYHFEGNVSLIEILDKFVAGSVVTYEVQLREGARLEEYLVLLRNTEKLVNDLSDVTPVNVLEHLQLRSTATFGEGLFYPDTYQYRRGESASSVLKQAFDLMNQELSLAWFSKSDDVQVDTKYELLIVASMIERESHIQADRERVSGVIHRRLALDMYLQIDPTVIYALGEDFRGRLWRRDLRIDSPYNTYREKGLPPSPICASSREAIRAAANPAPGKELFFVSRGDGTSQFSETLEEHNRAVARYIRNR